MLKKMKNNKGFPESLLFVFGMMIFLTMVGFSVNVINLTWQRYIVKREVENASRLYAIKWTELYRKPDCDGNFSTCSTNISDSELGAKFIKIIEMTVEEGNLNEAILVISRNKDASCTSAGVLLCVRSVDGNTTISGADWSMMKDIQYGEQLHSSLDVSYRWKGALFFQGKESSYRVSNKFANERFGNDGNSIGS